MILYYVRHGDPIYDPDSLTPLGEEQAKALAKRFLLYGLDKIYASDSNRAQLTAKPTSELLKKPITLCPWANEAIAGHYFAVTNSKGQSDWAFREEETVEKFNRPDVRALDRLWYTHPVFEGTAFAEGVAKTDAAFDEFLLSLGYRHIREKGGYEVVHKNPERVALFAHQGMGIVFLSSILDIPYPIFGPHFDLGHSSVTAIHFDDSHDFVVPRILQLSNDSHLYREGILTGYHNVLDI